MPMRYIKMTVAEGQDRTTYCPSD